ncbi:MAG TPA: tetratricopeptide repeat protein, partial [Candidatus Ozemobacteraceae bacterium]|nr:tetratricopeptide repeat protein [Candidatus Ozemobacteraceae bacterium]
MSDNNEFSFWSLVPLWLRLTIFFGLLIIAAPFLLIGHSKNGTIERSMKQGAEYLGKGNFIDAGKEYEKAGAQFGFLYDCYKLALNVTGGTYYKKNVCLMLRGMARAGAIAERLGNGDTDVDQEIKDARADLLITADIPADLNQARTQAKDELDRIEKMQPLVMLCKDGKYIQIMEHLDSMIKGGTVPFGEMVGMPTCYVLSECAVNLKTADAIETAKKICFLHSQKFKYPLFQKLAFKVTSLTAENVAVKPSAAKPTATAAKPAGDAKERFKLAMSYASKKDFQKAMPLFESCYKDNPKNVDFVYFFALAQSKAGKPDEAQKL